MHVIQHQTFAEKRTRRQRHKRLARLTALCLAVLLAFSGLGYWRFRQTEPIVNPELSFSAAASSELSDIRWPSYGQSAIGELNMGLLATNGLQKPAPTASTAKLITALTVLNATSLKPGEPGPTLTLTDKDVQLYNEYVAQNGAVAAVEVGEKITVYQMLEGMLIPSANNIADSLAIGVFGSLTSYRTQASNYLRDHSIVNTTVGTDASGMSPTTISTAADLVKIAQLAMQHPVIAEIVSKKQADIPVAGTIHSTNSLLGTHGIIGVKTGNTDEAGGVYVYASKQMVGDKEVTLLGAVMGAPARSMALQASTSLIKDTASNFQTATLAGAGQEVARFHVPWAGNQHIVVAKKIEATSWKADVPEPKIILEPFNLPAKVGTQVGTITYTIQGKKFSSPLVTKDPISGPSPWQRLFGKQL